MVKRIRRAASGTSAVERICSSEAAPGAPVSAASAPMSLALFREWETSKQLAAAFASHGRDANMDVTAALASITSVKPLSGTPRDNLRLCLASIRAVNGVKASIASLRATPFDAAEASHEARLEALWSALQPGRACERISSAWGDIGFQAKDPKSDFRGGGLLGLEQLLFFATTRAGVARRMIVEPESEEARYPWACAGINVTMEAVKAVDGEKLDEVLFRVAEGLGGAEGAGDGMIKAFHDVYGDMFERLHQAWLEAEPENVLAFGPIFAGVMKEAVGELGRFGRVRLGAERDVEKKSE